VSTLAENITPPIRIAPRALLDAALLTGGCDRPYAYGLAIALTSQNVHLDVIGSDIVDSPEMHTTPNLTFFNLWPAQQRNPTMAFRLLRTLRHYALLVKYAAVAEPRIFHILWNSKVEFIDRTLLMLYYKILGKKIALTAHNVNKARRDESDSFWNRFTLKIQYQFADHIFVHTRKMKDELLTEFGVRDQRVTVIRHPINNAFPDTKLTPAEAKCQLGLRQTEKVLLFFGKIKPYKGIEHLLTAFRKVVADDPGYKLLIVGEVQKGNEPYLEELRERAGLELQNRRIVLETRFVPDEEAEIYLKAADVLVLPYNEIFQSGVLFLAYSFGLPVVATDVGSFREEIVEGKTGYLCRPSDPDDLASVIRSYFASELYLQLSTRRQEIKDYAKIHHSWDAVAELTRNAYDGMLTRPSA